MLNISKHNINNNIDFKKYKSLIYVEKRKSKKVVTRLLVGTFGLFFFTMLLPWTQNIQSKGKITTLKPEQRPQTIQSIISGRIEKWYVQEGDFVNKGDTILFISEIKNEYLDPNLLGRTEDQLKAKESSVASYIDKIEALNNQIDALFKTSNSKWEQTKNKLEQAHLLVTTDSMAYVAAKINYNIAETQYKRMEQLYKEGLKSLTDLEKRNQTLQKAQAEMISKKNKVLTSKNKVINAEVERISIQAQYKDKISKAESDKFTALSNMYNAEAVVTKLQNNFTNYSLRTGMYYIKAPQQGVVTKVIQTGIGEIIKAGAEIVSIMPTTYDLAIETYVKPIDLPLLEKGQHVRIQFDGWPAIVFSGWPNTSHGTYGGIVYAIDNFASENGMYRIMVAQDKNDYAWPDALRVGTGTKNMILLKDVSIWYELWRKTNGFPPDYYKPITSINKKPK
ncbi:HlyD family efflux transporter periplasmic adaptor subunit [Lutibacter sp.]|uniref:HlyD family secretion protein n=1 Tax=Lutibacter sp. TaxID=1925666 RepID=UPI0025C12EA6|nr:HlyD family efflux transporter periplasmic adaptor subunit [Lutibacter sp.]MCF6168058.1 HlyD family secretion protein [Lutibacter sp.]